RYNYVDLATLIGQEDWHEYQVVETYTYAGLGGRPSAHWLDLFIDDVAQTRFVSSQSWNTLGEVVESIHPRCVGCDARPGMTTTREVDLTYSYGLLTGLETIAFAYSESTPDSDAWSFSYHPSGQLSQIGFPSGLLESWSLDPTGPSRPGRIEVKDGAGATLWTSGDYRYDGAGNITGMGGSWFRYDGVSRLVEAHVTTDPWSSGGLLAQTYSFDAFGNLQGISGASGHATPTSKVSNRLTSAGYDNRGNLTTWLATTYRYDALGSMWRTTAGTEDWVYVYDADGERVLEKKLGGELYRRWTLRGAGSQVQRIYTETGAGHLWQVEKDYLYRGDKPLWSAGSGQSRALHTDHLGTPRLLTDHNGATTEFHTYFPFGEEATPPFQDSERMKFTGHERDLGDPNSTGDDLDYMHARFCSPAWGRFLSVDPASSARPHMPQSWNRYAYAAGNPAKYVDPDGRVFVVSQEALDKNAETRAEVSEALSSVPLVGPVLAGAADALLAVFLPASRQEHHAATETMIMPSVGTIGVSKAGSSLSGRLSSLGTKLENIFRVNLTRETAIAAGIESKGGVVATKASGAIFDHVRKFETARTGVTSALKSLTNLASDPRLSDSQRAFARSLLSKFSKALDQVESFFERAAKGTPPPTN
ncbi:MAG TPA: RHS repeat-associated core domain-containing protein, partial [Thermoanaerobaculia bacterium]|nr:RHS repeat-associated core domain-containing protein [Thermoanaerobaculia bacterium]